MSTADHETGGLTLNRDIDGVDVYAYYTEQVRPVKHSTEFIAKIISNITDFNQVSSILADNGIPNLTQKEFDIMQRISPPFLFSIDEIINRRARIGFSTRGHTGVDVNVYSFGAGAERFVGNKENIEIGNAVVDLLRLDLQLITNLVNEYMNTTNSN